MKGQMTVFGMCIVHTNVLPCLDKPAGKVLVTNKKGKKNEKEKYIPACTELHLSSIPLIVLMYWLQRKEHEVVTKSLVSLLITKWNHWQPLTISTPTLPLNSPTW